MLRGPLLSWSRVEGKERKEESVGESRAGSVCILDPTVLLEGGSSQPMSSRRP